MINCSIVHRFYYLLYSFFILHMCTFSIACLTWGSELMYKQSTLSQCCFEVGLASAMLSQQ